jgi:hypothetical protein
VVTLLGCAVADTLWELALGVAATGATNQDWRARFWAAMRDHACTSLAGVPSTYTILTRIGFEDSALPDPRTLTGWFQV